jgi:hypothetical protein
MVDMRDYAAKYIKPDHVRDGPIQARIVALLENDQYGRPVLELETGSQFSLNDGNCTALIKAWGYESDDWIDQELSLEFGTYKDWKSGADKETVKVRAISPAKAGNGGAPSKPVLPPSRAIATKPDNMDDEIPW